MNACAALLIVAMTVRQCDERIEVPIRVQSIRRASCSIFVLLLLYSKVELNKDNALSLYKKARLAIV
jgi:hypothetical protein